MSKNKTGIYIKILTNYFQIISVIATFDIIKDPSLTDGSQNAGNVYIYT